ncbi:MAG: PKD domain-containing protein [Bacteroidia bacterium]
MKKLTLLKTLVALVAFFVGANAAKACNATFSHTNACAGDTVWFYAQDQMAIYTWDFGDSTSMVNINHDTATFHVYPVAGTYYVTLFVNIGAEWDYQTQIITVGTNCFGADFSSRCGGSNYMYFTDESIGGGTPSWNFGDPASGVNNTSTASAPYHLYPGPGSYLVTLITTSGSMADTSTQLINVAVNCLDATMYSNINGNCYGDSTMMSVYYTGTPTSYNWDFGDPASGAANTSTAATPKHLYSALGTYVARVIISDGVSTDTTYGVKIVSDCSVWAGDCNRDGEVNMEDIFPLGMYYGQTGTARPSASNSFTSQPCTDWPNFFSDFMYLQDLLNMKYADSNGDSTINNSDMTAINANYGMRHNTHNNVSAMPEATAADPTMYIQFAGASAYAGTTVTAPIYLGSSAKPIGTLYGYSFTINYDPSQIVAGSVSVNLSTNWLGNASNELMITKDNYASGKIDAAVVRYDKTQVLNGSGQIGTITLTIKPTASAGLLSLGLAGSSKILSTQMYGGATAGITEIFRPINLVGDMANILTGIDENALDNSVSVYPNPATDLINITVSGKEVKSMTISNAIGQIVYSSQTPFTNTTVIDAGTFAEGIYTLSCKTNEGTVIKKISIVR